MTMELSTKSFARTTTPETAAGPGQLAEPEASPPRRSRLPPFRFLSSLMSALADAIEPTLSRLFRRRRWIALERDDGAFEFHRIHANRVSSIGASDKIDSRMLKQLSASGADVELRLNRERTTTTSIKVPASGLEYIEQIIGSRLDRLTPWRPDKVLYGYSTASKPGPDGQLDVTFAATSRDIAAKSIERLAKLGVTPSRLGSAAEPLDQPLNIDLLRGQNDTSRNAQRRSIAIGATAFLALSLIAYAGSSLAIYDSEREMAQLDGTLAKTRQRLVTGLGNSAERQLDLKWIASKRVAVTKVSIIDRLAAALPDNTYLDEIDIEPGSVRIAGTSTEASALIAILQSQAGLSDAHFSAPVTREADGRDRFDITAAVDVTAEAVP